jgi:transcriptional regulator
MQLDINLQPYRFNREHLLCFTTPCACRIVSRSPGFRCVGLLLSKAFWRQLVHIDRTLGKIAIRNAFIALNEDEHERLSRFYDLLCLCADASGLQDSTETLYPLILGMFCQVRNICRRLEDTAMPMSHSEKILYDFLDLLHTHYSKQRRVSFYADELSLTPRHLSTVIRLVSGRSAARWIEEYVVLEAQILLRNSPMTIKEIAYKLGFNDQSLFSKYFSRVSGGSPESYRRSSTT